MNAKERILTLDPQLILTVRKQVKDWNEELLNPWHPSFAAKQLIQSLRNSCPKMTDALEEAEILEPWAEMLHDRVLDLKLANRLAGMTPSEAESEARKELIPWSWEMQEEWLEANCTDYEPEPDPDLYGPDDPRHSQYEEVDDECEVSFLNFDSGDLVMIQRTLVKSIKSLLGRDGIESYHVMYLGAMLSLVEKLPRHYEEYSGSITLSLDMGEGVGLKTITINEDGLMFEDGEIIRGEWGTDSSFKTILQVTEKSSSSSDPFFDLENWLSMFSSDADDVDVTFRVEWFPEHEMPTL